MRYLGFFICLVLMSSCATSADNTLIIGHRGAMGYETENTIASIEKAVELGVDMIEIDVFRIASGEIVVFHDDRVERLTNGTGSIFEYEISDLEKLELKGGHRIPQLEEVLRVMDARIPLNIELKGPNTAQGVFSITGSFIKDQGWQQDQFIISSFNWDELRAYRKLDPEARIAVLTEDDPLKAMDVAGELKAEAINPFAGLVSKPLVDAIHEEGYKVYVWTVNDPGQFKALKNMGVDGIFSDYPDRMN